MKLSPYSGYWFALIGVLILSPDALLIRLAGDDPWQINVWRGSLSGIVILLYCQFVMKGQGILEQIRPAGWAGILMMTLVTAASSLCFIFAMTHANVTDVLVIIAFAPLISALLSALFLKERVLLRTWFATLTCGIGLAILLGQTNSQSQPIGLVAALLCAFTLASQFVVIRSYPRADLTAGIGLGNLLSGLIAMGIATTLAVRDWQQLSAILGTALIVIPISFILFALALRYITAAETALIMLIESVLGSFWVWLILAETPSTSTVLAGVLILSTLTVYGLLTLRDMKLATANQHHPE